MLEIKGIRFEVEITHKRIHNLYLRLKDNKIIASAPVNMEDYEVYRFIDKKKGWIYKAYSSRANQKRVSCLYRGGEIFYIFDEPYCLIRQIGKSRVMIQDKTIILFYKDESEEGIKYLYKYLDRMLLKKAEVFLNKHLSFLKDYGYYQIPELKARAMTSKWGVCYTKKNRIGISSYLIHYPEECLEYVMVHEMTHFIIPDHSKRFYEVMANNFPAYKKAVELLRY